MIDIKAIIQFIIINFIGFSTATLCFVIGLRIGVFTNLDEQAAATLRDALFTGTLITWLVCAIFSVASFFTEGDMRRVFLWSPIVIPLLYGLNVLF